ncbi:MAG: hypothetical protein WCI17_11685 [bacterium]
MNGRRHAGISLLAALLLAAPAPAQTAAAPTLENLKVTYEKARKIIDAGLEQQKAAARVSYGKAVEESMTAYRLKGDLDTYLLLEKARKDVEGGAPVPAADAEGLHAGLVQAAGIYQKGMAGAEAEKARRMSVLLGRYMANLQDLMKRLMMQEKIEEAKVVNEELERARAARSALPEAEKPAPAATAAPPAAAATVAAAPAREKEDYPAIAGSWNEENGGTHVISQNGPYWTAKCSYTHQRPGDFRGENRAEIRGEVSRGTVTKDLQIKGEQRYFKAPASMKPRSLAGTVSADGQTITFTVGKPGGDKNNGDADEEIVWTRQGR